MIGLLAAAVVAFAPFELEVAGPAVADRMVKRLTAGVVAEGCGAPLELMSLGPAIASEVDHCYGRASCLVSIARSFAKAPTAVLGAVHRGEGEFTIDLRVFDTKSGALVGRLVQPTPMKLDMLMSWSVALIPRLCEILRKPRDGEELELTIPDQAPRASPPAPVVALPEPPPPPPPEPVAAPLLPPEPESLLSSIEDAIVDAVVPDPTPEPVELPPVALPDPPVPIDTPAPKPPVVAAAVPTAPAVEAFTWPSVPPSRLLAIGAGVAALTMVISGTATLAIRSGDGTTKVLGRGVHTMTRADAEFANTLAITADLAALVALGTGVGAWWTWTDEGAAP